MSTEAPVTTEVVCNDCSDAYVVLTGMSLAPLFFVCRRCRLKDLGEYVEKLIEAGPEQFGLGKEDFVAFNHLFFESIEEMYSHLMRSGRKPR